MRQIKSLLDLETVLASATVLAYFPYPSAVVGPAASFGEWLVSEGYRAQYQRIQNRLCALAHARPDNKMCFLVQPADEQFWVGLKDWVVYVGAKAQHYDGFKQVEVVR